METGDGIRLFLARPLVVENDFLLAEETWPTSHSFNTINPSEPNSILGKNILYTLKNNSTYHNKLTLFDHYSHFTDKINLPRVTELINGHIKMQPWSI